MVYVLDIDGNPLMPTERHGKVRRLLKEGKARVVKRCPFTIQLLYDSTRYIQEINLGIDAGSKHIGVSATTKEKVLYEADVELRNDIVELISTRRELRRARRSRKTRYRKDRFNNRVSTRRNYWLAPSIKQKIQTHLTVIDNIYKILPVKNLIVETASFNIQKIKNPNISSEEYQRGEQLNFWNVREYVLFRDGHTCQCCKGKSRDKILNVHHIESRKTGGNAPNNLITLCETCHKGYHNGVVKLPKSIHRGMSFRDAAFMGIMRKTLLSELRKIYPNVKETYGYITKNTRISYNLPKEHYIDARCISGNPIAKPLGHYFYQKKVRCHNRQLHKMTILKGGIRKNNQADYLVKGFRLFDKVKYNNKEYFIFARRKSGFFDVRNFLGEKVNRSSISYKKLKFLETRHTILTERRMVTNHL
jgi:5-methylcytosine-specific restriction endonuclease McrA